MLRTVLQLVVSPVLAVATALWFDRACRRRSLLPPGFRSPATSGTVLAPAARRLLAGALLAGVFWVGVFAPVATLGATVDVDLEGLALWQLFLLHGVLLAALALWYLLGFSSSTSRENSRWWAQFGLRTQQLATELGIGAAAGLGAWAAVLLLLLLVGVGMWSLGGQEMIPSEVAPIIPWMASLPIAVRLALSASAGVAEELFFRGFLQPRIGVLGSSALFVLAHASYGQPLMLVGIAFLSLVFALLVRWRQNIWPAIAAHALFDAVQLVFVIPWALRQAGGGGVPLA